MTDKNPQLAYIQKFLEKIETVGVRGDTIMNEIPGLVQKAQKIKHDPSWLEIAEVDQRVQKRRYGTTQAAELAGISHSLLYAAEQDGRLPEPEYRNDTAKKVRAGYTMNHINCIRRTFGTAPRKPEGSSAAVVGVLNLKGGSQKLRHAIFFHSISQCKDIGSYFWIQTLRGL